MLDLWIDGLMGKRFFAKILNLRKDLCFQKSNYPTLRYPTNPFL